MNKKYKLGQFNTTKKDYILQGMEEYATGKQWVDPYAGDGDLLDWANLHGATSIEGFDVDPSKVSEIIKHQDTLLEPPNFQNKYVIANPPYLARNKCKDKTLYDKYNQDDLYKIALLTINGCKGGIFIVPLNFLSSVYANNIRDIFFKNYKIKYCKVFEERVFDDTDYTVCAFYFELRDQEKEIDTIDVLFRPSNNIFSFQISKKHHWILGEEFYQYIDNIKHTGIGRWTQNDMTDAFYQNDEEKIEKETKDNRKRSKGDIFINDFNRESNECFFEEALNDIILIRAMDTGTMDGRIGLFDIRQFSGSNKPILLGLETSRNKAHVKFYKNYRPTIEEQLKVIDLVNKKLEDFRQKYNSVFITAFRNSTESYSRKRISFDILYKMIAHALKEIKSQMN
jgi:hypothetical protein